jgi:DNA polymerase-1
LTGRQLEYARIDVEHMHVLREIFDAELKAADLTRIFKVESDLLPIVAKMELHGFAVSVERMEKIRSREDEVAEELERTIRAEFNLPELNVNSPPQLLVAFNNSGANLKSTGEESLVRSKHPMGAKILEYREHKKLAGSIKGLLAKVQNDRLHSEFKPIGTIHGRGALVRRNQTSRTLPEANCARVLSRARSKTS